MNRVGRPYNENALKRVGKRLDFLLSKEDFHRFEVLTIFFEQTKSELLRTMIRNLYKQIGDNQHE